MRNGNECEFIGQCAAFREVLEQVDLVAQTDCAVLIQGETGTGKEMIARAIHSRSTRSQWPFVKLNCAAIPEGLLESELFGHERGAFTGALARRSGRFQLAHRGTLFLDEVGDLPLALQPKLLRALQEGEFEKLGSSETIRVDVRILTATNQNLKRMVSERTFRADLYYRLHVFPITLPPLRERVEDIPLMVSQFVREAAARANRTIALIPDSVMDALCSYDWPGNIRELQNFVERAVILSEGPFLRAPLAELRRALPGSSPPEGSSLEAVLRAHIIRTLRATNWVVGGTAGAAAKLGLPRTTLLARMQRLGISRSTDCTAGSQVASEARDDWFQGSRNCLEQWSKESRGSA
ncbi:MAG TPA: sigma 54-interacting transcriptional regulator [Bryobacteraceae bacterium]|nr:sigma 54-interacting transcriptional regulator [Bryobacteraceae bacterium]